MKRLYLIRHAKSSWQHPGLADHERSLNGRGKRDAPAMGARLKKRRARPELILSSPAKRALKTAKVIAEALEYPKNQIVVDDTLYASSASGVLESIQRIADDINRLMVFGHNPEFTELANHLSDFHVDNMPTCGVFCVDFNIVSWAEVSQGSGEFVFFDFPKLHA